MIVNEDEPVNDGDEIALLHLFLEASSRLIDKTKVLGKQEG